MARLLPIVALALAAAGSVRGDWEEFRSGPFEVLTDAGSRSGQEALAHLEQLRHTLGAVLGKTDPKTAWPVRVVIFDSDSEYKANAGPAALSRDSIIGALPKRGPMPREWMRELARILIESNASRMPAEIESGLADFFSTLEVDGSRVTAGTPPLEAERTFGWAKIHLLTVSPAYYGKLRVLLYNLQQGVPAAPAYRNTFGKTPEQIDAEAKAYLAAGKFETTSLSGRPISPRRDLRASEVEPLRAELAQADLLLKNKAAQARAAYEMLRKQHPQSPAPAEGLGILAAREGRSDEAVQQLEAAANAGSTNAQAWLEYGRLAKKPEALENSAKLNPNWARPHVLLAEQSDLTGKKVVELKAATSIEPRDAALWQALAQVYLARKEYPDADKAWAGAQRAAVDDAERDRIQKKRAEIEQARLDYEAEQRRLAREAEQREIQRLKDAAMAEVRAAESRANRQAPQLRPDQKVEQWWEGAAPSASVSGELTRVECGGALRITVRTSNGKLVKLAVREPAKVIVLGGGELDFVCGVQKKPRGITVEYFEKRDSRLGTAGDVAAVRYQ